jgi:hypothetical protein
MDDVDYSCAIIFKITVFFCVLVLSERCLQQWNECSWQSKVVFFAQFTGEIAKGIDFPHTLLQTSYVLNKVRPDFQGKSSTEKHFFNLSATIKTINIIFLKDY